MKVYFYCQDLSTLLSSVADLSYHLAGKPLQCWVHDEHTLTHTVRVLAHPSTKYWSLPSGRSPGHCSPDLQAGTRNNKTCHKCSAGHHVYAKLWWVPGRWAWWWSAQGSALDSSLAEPQQPWLQGYCLTQRHKQTTSEPLQTKFPQTTCHGKILASISAQQK